MTIVSRKAIQSRGGGAQGSPKQGGLLGGVGGGAWVVITWKIKKVIVIMVCTCIRPIPVVLCLTSH